MTISIRQYLLLLIVTMTAIPLAIIGYDTWKQFQNNLDESYLMLERLVSDVESDQKAFHTGVEQLLTVVGDLPAAKRRDAASLSSLFAQLLRKSPQLNNIMTIDATGRIWASAQPFSGVVTTSDRRYFRNALATGNFSSGEFTVSRIQNKPAISFGYPIRGSSGEIRDIAAVSFELANYESMLAARKHSKDTSLVLVDHQGTILYSSVGPQYTGRKDKLFRHMQTVSDSGRFEAYGNSGIKRIHFYTKVRLNSEHKPYLYIRSGMATHAISRELGSGLFMDVGVMLLLLAVASGLTLYLSKKFVLDKIGALQGAINRVAEGDLTVRVSDYVSGGELGELGRSFDAMTHKLNIYITERKNSEELVAESAEQLRVIFEASQAGIILVDQTGVITFANRRMAEMFACPMQELIGSKYPDHLHPDAKESGDTRMRQLISGEIQFVDNERHYQRRDGTDFWGYLSGRRLETTDGRLQGLIGIIADITDRKQAETKLRRSQETFAAIFNNSPDSININRLDDAVFIDINEGFTNMLGYTREEVIGIPSTAIGVWVDTKDRSKLARQLREKGIVKNLEVKLRRKNGSIITALISSTLIEVEGVTCTLNIARDITERDIILTELNKVQKLESLGILAGGIAHDFNNILTGIMGNISFAKMKLDTPQRAYDLLTNAEKASQRAAELAKQLLVFAKGGKPVKKAASLQEIVTDTLSLALTGSKIKGVLDIPEPLQLVEVDEGQVSQAFHNIIINAAHSMPEGGKLTVAGKNVELPDNNLLNLPGGRYVLLSFSDEGCGISEDDQKKIFDPYFTTKSGGTGLGLASTYAIIKNHDGQIVVSSTIGAGTIFSVYLPSLSESGLASTAAGEISHIPQGCGSVLVMDDEELIRNLASEMLDYLGYRVTTCTSGEEAISRYAAAREAGAPFSAVIMDLTIPGGMGGEEAARRILALDPDAVLLVSSGYSDNPVMADYRSYGFRGAIAKPYIAGELGIALATALER